MALLTIETDGTVRDLADGISLGADWTSNTVDFTHCRQGSLHVKYTGNDAADGYVVLEASLVDEDGWFDEIDNTQCLLNGSGDPGDRKNILFSHETLGFRFVRLKYYKVSNTTGTMDLKVCGKSGGWR